MTTIRHTHKACSMMDEPGLRRRVERLDSRIPSWESDAIPTISSEMLRCYDQRARALRSESWVGLGRRIATGIRWLIVPDRAIDDRQPPPVQRLNGSYPPCAS